MKIVVRTSPGSTVKVQVMSSDDMQPATAANESLGVQTRAQKRRVSIQIDHQVKVPHTTTVKSPPPPFKKTRPTGDVIDLTDDVIDLTDGGLDQASTSPGLGPAVAQKANASKRDDNSQEESFEELPDLDESSSDKEEEQTSGDEEDDDDGSSISQQVALQTTTAAVPAYKNDSCAVCLDNPVHPLVLGCGHRYCYLCAKGLVEGGDSLCSLCRCPISRHDLQGRTLSDAKVAGPSQAVSNSKVPWFYQAGNGRDWWQFEERNSQDLEECFETDSTGRAEMLICGQIYVIDFSEMTQRRKNGTGRIRRIRRGDRQDGSKCLGVAGMKTTPVLLN